MGGIETARHADDHALDADGTQSLRQAGDLDVVSLVTVLLEPCGIGWNKGIALGAAFRPMSVCGGSRRKPMLRNAAGFRWRLTSKLPICMRSWRSRSRSISATANWLVEGNRSVSASVAPFSKMDACPSQARSVVDSPAPAAA